MRKTRDLGGLRGFSFAKGAALEDPARLFNASLQANTRRTIDVHEGDRIDEKALIREAVAFDKAAAKT
jgi:hypothetical protein